MGYNEILKGSAIRLTRQEPDMLGYEWAAEYSWDFHCYYCSCFRDLGDAVDYIRRKFGQRGIELMYIRDDKADKLEVE